jgi:acetyltransferase-like isoleucine patch superfamily enzyme
MGVLPKVRNGPTLSVFSVKKKVCKLMAKYFPVCSVRISALRAAGYKVGNAVYVGEELHVTDEVDCRAGRLTIGDRVAIAQRVMIILSSYANNSLYRDLFGSTFGDVVIERDAWIGAGAIILPNVTIGEGSIVGAGSVVTKSVPPLTIVAGNPARVIRQVELHITEPLTPAAQNRPQNHGATNDAQLHTSSGPG